MDWVAYKLQQFISHRFGACESTPSQGGWVLVKALCRAADCQLLAVSSHGGRGWGALWGLFYNHLPKALPPNTIGLGITVSTCEFGSRGTQTFRPYYIVIIARTHPA